MYNLTTYKYVLCLSSVCVPQRVFAVSGFWGRRQETVSRSIEYSEIGGVPRFRSDGNKVGMMLGVLWVILLR